MIHLTGMMDDVAWEINQISHDRLHIKVNHEYLEDQRTYRCERSKRLDFDIEPHDWQEIQNLLSEMTTKIKQRLRGEIE